MNIHFKFKSLVLSITILITAAFPISARCAADDCNKIINNRELTQQLRLQYLSAGKCIGDEFDQSQITKNVHSTLKLGLLPSTPQQTKDSVIEALDYLRGQLEDLRKSADISPEATKLIVSLEAEIMKSRIPASDPWDEKIRAVNKQLSPSYYAFDVSSFTIGRNGGAKLDVKESIFDKLCTAPVSKCDQALTESINIVRISTLTESALTYLNFWYIEDAYKQVSILDKKWGEYFTKARSQFPWELWLNSLMLPDDRLEVNGNKLGFRQAPEQQMIILHPEVAFEYVSDAAAGSKFQGVVALEVLGGNWWHYNKDGSMGGALFNIPVGASLVTTIGDRAGATSIGYGILIHIANNYSLGVTMHDNKWGAVISGDLNKAFLKASDSWQKIFRYIQ